MIILVLLMASLPLGLLQEEKSRLLKEMEALQEKLRTLEEQRGPSITSLRTSTRKNKLLRESIRGQQLSLATAQCVVSGLLVRAFLFSVCYYHSSASYMMQ